MTLPNVHSGSGGDSRGRPVHAFFLIGILQSDGTAHAPPNAALLHGEQKQHGDIALLNARETKPPGEKMIGFFRLCTVAFASATFCVKTDDDTYVQTIRLETNLRFAWQQHLTTDTLVNQRQPQGAARGGGGIRLDDGPLLYIGATLWASYIGPDQFQVCGHGMGPLMAVGAAKSERCAERGAVGPFPYVAGTLEVLSMPLARYIVQQSVTARFVQSAHARTPPAWNIGEDTVLGMWVHQTPFAVTALHWGWDKIHDLCFKCMDKTQLWKPITKSSVVVHIKGHQANWQNFLDVHTNFSRVCDDQCQREHLSFDVPSLGDLCRRNDAIRTAYSKCSLV